jgi:hypothetical protein
MILTTLASIWLNGIAILVGILSVMRLLYRLGLCEPPSVANDRAVSNSAVIIMEPEVSDPGSQNGRSGW